MQKLMRIERAPRVLPVLGIFLLFLFVVLGCNRDRKIEDRNLCISNLRIIDAAKNEWAIEKHKTTNDVPTWTDIQPFLPPFDKMKDSIFGTNCPSGGHYSINRLGENPSCSIDGHVLP